MIQGAPQNSQMQPSSRNVDRLAFPNPLFHFLQTKTKVGTNSTPSTYGSINTRTVIITVDTMGESNEEKYTFLRNIKVDA